MNRTKKTTSNGRSVEDKQQRAHNINNVEPLQRHGWLSLNAHVARLTHSTEVRYLDISDVVFSASEWSWLVDIIPTMANLEVLSLCGNALTDEQVSSLLQHVMPRGSSSGPLGVAPSRSERRYATPNTAGLQYLQVLSLASNRLTYKSMSTMYRFVLWHTATLTALDLSDNPLRDHGAHVLAIGLAKQSLHPLLDHLTRAEAGAATTSWFPVPFQSRMKKVAAAVRRRDAPTAAIAAVFGGLTVLSLARCRVSIRGVHDVLRSIVHIPNLTSVDMSENTVTYTTPLSAFDNDITAQHHAHGGSAGGIAVLESLNLSGCLLGEQLTPSGAHEMLLWVLFHATHLRELHLADSHRISFA
ncbi:leucine-rich repeat protein, putative [Bodo saltans]|uniref:Leucine-rich repeat protein, putative n=1 Tax=Bodo saltans TaxID=75058 RepID=A0A0S4JHM5_BODSA|nr:leucine-rich repeat protein, putative [Bodo saltans]|eukprot:CUG90967.1 leucine-rich repeat protein, putative [Bodo saltans]